MIKIKVNQIKMNVKHSIDDVVKEALKKVHTQKNNLVSYKIIKKSIDARKSPIYIYAVQLELNKYNLKKLPKDVSIVKKEEKYTTYRSHSGHNCLLKVNHSEIAEGQAANQETLFHGHFDNVKFVLNNTMVL